MRHVPNVGERVVSERFAGIGIVEAVKVLKYLARVRWPSGLIAWVPLEDLQTARVEAAQ